MVSAAKLRRAQERAIAARPYGEQSGSHAGECRCRGCRERGSGASAAACTCAKRSAFSLIVVTADTGLGRRVQCESARMAQRFHRRATRSRDSALKPSAARAAITSAAVTYTLSGEHIGIVDKPNYEKAREIARQADRAVQQGGNRRGLSVRQRIQERDGAEPGAAREFFRWKLPEAAASRSTTFTSSRREELLSGSAAALCGSADLSRAARIDFGRACRAHDGHGRGQLECGRRDRKLTLNMNRVRQASITREIIEIVSGARRFVSRSGAFMSAQQRSSRRQSRSGGRPRRRHSVPRRPDARSSTRRSASPAKASTCRSRSISSAKSRSTSAKAACAPSRCSPPTAWCAA